MRVVLTIILLLNVAVGQTVNDLRPTVTMKEYVDMQMTLNKECQEKLDALRSEHLLTDYGTMDKRLDGMNEFRETLRDSNSTYVTWQALIGLIIGVSGFLFGYANYRRNQESAKSSGSVIRSGDNVEVKK